MRLSPDMIRSATFMTVSTERQPAYRWYWTTSSFGSGLVNDAHRHDRPEHRRLPLIAVSVWIIALTPVVWHRLVERWWMMLLVTVC
ncbi:MAG: hypothetical protein R2706_04230 [Acidimicrobiales bacterium]